MVFFLVSVFSLLALISKLEFKVGLPTWFSDVNEGEDAWNCVHCKQTRVSAVNYVNDLWYVE